MIVPESKRIILNGINLSKESTVIASERTTIDLFDKGLAIKTIDYDTSITNKRQFLLSKAFNLVRGDTTTALVMIAPEFHAEFKELNGYFGKRFTTNNTLVFVAFTAEEIGGFGSRYFSEQLNPDKVVAMFNIEMIGKPSKWGQNFAFITGYERSDFGEILQKNLTGTPFEFKPDPYTKQNLFYRSDNATLARLGVPAHSISTDQIDSDKLYHTVNDEVESLDMKNITSTIKAIALSSKSIVNGTDTPKRIDKATVR